MSPRFIRWFAIIILPLGIYVGIFYSDWIRFLETPIIAKDQAPLNYVFLPGSSVGDVARYLNRRGVLKSPYYFMLLARFSGTATRLKAGEYQFDPGTTPIQLLEQMAAGRVIIRELTLVEGWTFAQFLQHMQANPHITHTFTGLTPNEIMVRLGYVGIGNPEGWLFPDTYRYVGGTADATLIRHAYQAMSSRLATEWATRTPGLPYRSPYDALIVASLVEKEAKIDSDRPRIAGVILKRLQKNMPLQIDSTIIYGLNHQYSGVITKANLHADSPYNTYTRKGLPPTPIAMPGLASLHAALHPSLENALFFVASGNGGHHFSSTLGEHTRAVQHYRSLIAKQTKKADS